MNRIYNVIWNKTKKCYVVVSEIVKSGGGKVKSLHTGKTHVRMGAVMAVAALLLGVNITSVNAAMIIDAVNQSGYAVGSTPTSTGSKIFNYENPGNMGALEETNIPAQRYTANFVDGISIGTHNDILDRTETNANYNGIAIGNRNKAVGGMSIALGNYAQAMKASSMAIGTATLSSGFNSLAMMRQSAATADFATAIGTTAWADGKGSFAMGYSATAKGDQSIAIGAA